MRREPECDIAALAPTVTRGYAPRRGRNGLLRQCRNPRNGKRNASERRPKEAPRCGFEDRGDVRAAGANGLAEDACAHWFVLAVCPGAWPLWRVLGEKGDGGEMNDGNAEDLAFMQWVRSASTRELATQFRYAVDWQQAAIGRELQRRIKSGTTGKPKCP